MTSLTRIGSLEFNDIKASIKNYLKAQTEFQDYNFEGAGITQLINILAYNAHYDALSANFMANEMFMDTAVKRSSVVSRAKELGYTPTSRRSATATLNITFSNVTNANNITALTLLPGTRFTSIIGQSIATFVTTSTTVASRSIVNGQFVYTGTVTVYEGILTQQTLTYNALDNIVHIPNLDIDTSTLKVEVWQNGQWSEFVKPSTLLTVGPNDKIYMIQEGFDGYEIYFGDGVFGLPPANQASIRTTYVVTSGQGNGALNFTLASAIANATGSTISISAKAQSDGAKLLESIESIRFNATNQYGTQNRAVIASDYAALAISNFSFVKDAFAWDGATSNPPQFGKVVLCVQPTIGDALTDAQKNILTTFLQSKAVAGTQIAYLDPNYIGLVVSTTIRYNTALLNTGVYELSAAVSAAIFNYAANSVQRFNGVFRSSALAKIIDSSNYAIVSSLTTVSLLKEIVPTVFGINNFKFSYANELVQGSFVSSKFYISGSENGMQLQDDGKGSINIVYFLGGQTNINKSNVGTINYSTGEIQVNNLTMASLDGMYLSFTATPLSQDVLPSNNIILNLAQDDISVTPLADYV